jgi:hypothetical protein
MDLEIRDAPNTYSYRYGTDSAGYRNRYPVPVLIVRFDNWIFVKYHTPKTKTEETNCFLFQVPVSALLT